jgi:acid phosphatase type 7
VVGDNTTLMAYEEVSSPHTYKASDMCMPPATDEMRFVDPGWLHELVLTKLNPDTKYWYQIKGTSQLQDSWGVQYEFTSSPLTSPVHEPFSYIVYGDMGVCLSLDRLPCDIIPMPNASITTAMLSIYEVEQLNARMVHHFGDISYARGESAVWEAWFPLVEAYAAQAPYMVSIGNHEYDHYHDPNQHDPSGVDGAGGWHPEYATFGPDSHGECGVPMYQRYHMPSEMSEGNSLFWYSFDFASVHTIMLSSEHDCSSNSPQYMWLESDLAKVDRSNTPWLIVELHRPLYNNEDYPGDYNTSVILQQCYEDLFLSYGVDLVLAGHYHAYLRSSKINHDQRVADDEHGIYHFTIGSAGASVDKGSLMPDKDWVEYFEQEYGYGRITIYNSTALFWEFIRNRASSGDNVPVAVDSKWIKKVL